MPNVMTRADSPTQRLRVMVFNSDRGLNWRAFIDAAVSRHRSECDVFTIYCIGETALAPGASPYTPRGWTFVSQSRSCADPNGKYSGGVAMLLPPGLIPNKLTVPACNDVEPDDLLFCAITSRGVQIVIGLMYLPPSLGINSVGWLSQLDGARAMLCAIQDGIVKDVPNTSPIYLCGDFNARVGGDHLSFDGWSSEDSTTDTRGRALIRWLQPMSLRIVNDVNADQMARFTHFCPNKQPSVIDFFIAEEHRVDVVKDVSTLQFGLLDPRDAMHQLLMQRNHRAIVATLELHVGDAIPCATDEGTKRALIGARVLDQVSDKSRQSYVSFGNDAVINLWSRLGRDNVRAHHLIDVLREGGTKFLTPDRDLEPIRDETRRAERQCVVRAAVRKLHAAIRTAEGGDLGPRHPLRSNVYRSQ